MDKKFKGNVKEGEEFFKLYDVYEEEGTRYVEENGEFVQKQVFVLKENVKEPVTYDVLKQEYTEIFDSANQINNDIYDKEEQLKALEEEIESLKEEFNSKLDNLSDFEDIITEDDMKEFDIEDQTEEEGDDE